MTLNTSPYIVSIDGNIGAGKSEALEMLRSNNFSVVMPPSAASKPLLERFLEDPVEYALPLALRDLVEYHRSYHEARGISFFERHPGALRHVFAQLQFNEGVMSHAAFEVFKGYYENLGWSPDVVVYLDTPVERCRSSSQKPAKELSLHAVSFQYEHYLKYAGCPVIRATSPGHVVDICTGIARAHARGEPLAFGSGVQGK